MPGFIGVPELLLLGVVALLVFGPKRLPEMGRSLGHGLREFKDSVTGNGPATTTDETAAADSSTAAAPTPAPVELAPPTPATAPQPVEVVETEPVTSGETARP